MSCSSSLALGCPWGKKEEDTEEQQGKRGSPGKPVSLGSHVPNGPIPFSSTSCQSAVRAVSHSPSLPWAATPDAATVHRQMLGLTGHMY